MNFSPHLPPERPTQPVFPDALMPDAIARAMEDLGARKVTYDAPKILALAILAGAFVAFGALFATIAMSGAEGMMPYGVTRLLGGLVFSLGLVLVIVGGAQLFTSDALLVMAWASGRASISQMLRVWTLVWVGNFIGALGTAVLVYLSGQYTFGHGAVGETALYMASAKANLPVGQAFILGILCNVLVCLAAWLALGARSVGDKVLAVIFPVSAFVAAGFEHCVANMYFVPLGLMIEHGAGEPFLSSLHHRSPPIDPLQFAINLGAVTLGNWIGGALLVGAVYWFIFCRERGHGHG